MSGIKLALTTGSESSTTRRGARSDGQLPPEDRQDRFDGTWFERRIEQPLHVWYQKVIIEKLLRQSPLPPSQDGRHISLEPGRLAALQDERRGHPYISNSIRSARYTPWDFLPKQFLFQATRLSNFYFICIGIPQTIPGLSTTGNYTTILPLLFFMLLTVIKEGYDDYRRHRMDAVENNREANVLTLRNLRGAASLSRRSIQQSIASVYDLLRSHMGIASSKPQRDAQLGNELLDLDDEFHWSSTKWKDVRVGDILRVTRDNPIPADLALIYASGENGVAYIDTMALDGETNLKSRQAPDILSSCSNISTIKACKAEFVSEDPNRNLYEFNGRVTVNNTTIPLTLNETLLRGSVLRNTEFAIGVVISTGEECKIRQHANHHPKAKKPHLENYSNQVVLTLIAYVIILSVGTSGGYLLWHKSTETRLWYIEAAFVEFKQIIIGFLIMFNNVIPLALYVSLEIVKIGQMIMIHSDVEMFDEASNTPMVCNTNTILENLGQVKYILSDKTGTLTENVMFFRKMSIAGVAWSHVDRSADSPSSDNQIEEKACITVQDEEKPLATRITLEVPKSDLSPKISVECERPAPSREMTTNDMLRFVKENPKEDFSQKVREFVLGLALCHTALPEQRPDGTTNIQASSPDEVALVRAAQDLGYKLISRSSETIVLGERLTDGTERRLVYTILDVIEFSSLRKRMSVVVACPDGLIWLLCKGADSAIMPRLSNAALASRKSVEVRRSIQLEREQRRSTSIGPRQSMSARPSLALRRQSSMDIRPNPKRDTLDVPKNSHEVRIRTTRLDSTMSINVLNSISTGEGETFSRCFRHIDQFATEGLRTLLFAQRYLSHEEYNAWKHVYKEAVTALEGRSEQVDAASEMIEQGLELLGATAIEDKLQKGVPETIEKLRRANIKIWMLTGDKRETAINIAHAARICTPTSDLFKIDVAKGDIRSQIQNVAFEIRSNKQHSVVIIDGHTLEHIDKDADVKRDFYSLIPTIDSVVCCRASPSQKAGIVKAIRKCTSNAVTLAIGDGANDVAMIQSSHVGVGISGKEGLQAARVADYSIAQFRFLQRLLLVHGRWNYMRTAKFILMTFWKEQFFYMMQALYQRYNGYTGTSLYENWSLTVLNTLFTSLCVIIPGIFEQDLRAKTLLAIPELYAYGQRNCGLNLSIYVFWMVLGTLQGVLVWFISLAGYGWLTVTNDNGLFALGDLCFSLGIVWTNVSLLIIETHHKTYVVGASFLITVAGWWAWNGFMSGVYSSNISPYDVRHGFSQRFGDDPAWWLTLVVALSVLAVIEAIHKTFSKHFVVIKSWPFLYSRRLRTVNEAVDLGLWQEMEQDPEIRSRLDEMAEASYGGIKNADKEMADDMTNDCRRTSMVVQL